jgi:hypothetical protein
VFEVPWNSLSSVSTLCCASHKLIVLIFYRKREVNYKFAIHEFSFIGCTHFEKNRVVFELREQQGFCSIDTKNIKFSESLTTVLINRVLYVSVIVFVIVCAVFCLSAVCYLCVVSYCSTAATGYKHICSQNK